MKLEAGKYYRTRDGQKAFIGATDPFGNAETHYKAVGFTDGGYCHWAIDGRFWSSKEDGLDIVSEWKEPREFRVDLIEGPAEHFRANIYGPDGKLTHFVPYSGKCIGSATITEAI